MMLMIIVLFAAQQGGAARPQALVNFERARSQLCTGRSMCVVTGGPRVAGMPAQQFGMQMGEDGDLLYTYYGDLEGVFARDEYGYPFAAGGAATLVQHDLIWYKATHAFSGTIVPRSVYRWQMTASCWGTRVDLRTIGMAPTWDSLEGQDVASVLSNATRGCTGYSTEREGSVHRVTVNYPDNRTMVYEIDEAKGWKATRITGTNTRSAWECVIQLRENRGTWFPEMVTLCQNGEIRTEWIVTDASFNSPDDPQGWGPGDIGFEVGMLVGIRGEDHRLTASPDGKGSYWDGQKPAPCDEVFSRINSGELEPGPTLKRMRALKGDYRPPGTELL